MLDLHPWENPTALFIEGFLDFVAYFHWLQGFYCECRMVLFQMFYFHYATQYYLYFNISALLYFFVNCVFILQIHPLCLFSPMWWLWIEYVIQIWGIEFDTWMVTLLGKENFKLNTKSFFIREKFFLPANLRREYVFLFTLVSIFCIKRLFYTVCCLSTL